MNDATRLPPDLQAAMRARDEAFYAVDPAQWGKYTAAQFTTVQQNGNFYTRADRIENLKTQKQRPYVPREREQFEIQGDVVVTRFFSGGLWVVEVWKRVDGAWASVMSQATTASATGP
ncbi:MULTISPECIES: nuclear transport factor 2 family protein [Ramlibacter]|uniref:Nuclear transport factor 2 family protein n=1 Tax=Ramlibacter pinisoli TaxID=2682844 RepID=A0A6N8IZA8_9BURK|nr:MULTISPECIES: nuclear transport factor 2 family protein [Ramlibacter]MBA2962166.1 nuclear transport factor 2 family protein [Ramlibacter sp. CGMCC 1.13660]MVQ32108.1 nuclear transport factor 2 family protein [Ramlibacter pinisoli]